MLFDRRVLAFLLAMLLVLPVGCSSASKKPATTSTDVPIEVLIVRPPDGKRFVPDEKTDIEVIASDGANKVEKVDLYVNGELIESSTTPSLTAEWTVPAEGNYKIRAIATDDHGKTVKNTVQVKSLARTTEATASAETTP